MGDLRDRAIIQANKIPTGRDRQSIYNTPVHVAFHFTPKSCVSYAQNGLHNGLCEWCELYVNCVVFIIDAHLGAYSFIPIPII